MTNPSRVWLQNKPMISGDAGLLISREGRKVGKGKIYFLHAFRILRATPKISQAIFTRKSGSGLL